MADETSGKQLSLHELSIQGKGNVVTHQNSAGLEGSVPSQTEVLAIDLGLAETPIRVLPQGSLAGGVGPSTAKRTLRVTPRIVRSPSTDNSPAPTTLMPVDLKCKVGNFST